MLAVSIGFSIGPLAVVAHETIRRIGITGEYSDGTLSMPHSVFKISQIDVLVGNVLETKSVFLTLSGQVSLPISEVKRAIVVPKDVFTLI
jgi:hypothetical protein